jgi:hypothetical protein
MPRDFLFLWSNCSGIVGTEHYARLACVLPLRLGVELLVAMVTSTNIPEAVGKARDDFWSEVVETNSVLPPGAVTTMWREHFKGHVGTMLSALVEFQEHRVNFETVLQFLTERRLVAMWQLNQIRDHEQYHSQLILTQTYEPTRMSVMQRIFASLLAEEDRSIQLVEVGVFQGDFSVAMLNHFRNCTYVGVDPYAYDPQTSKPYMTQIEELDLSSPEQLAKDARTTASRRYASFGSRADLRIMRSVAGADTVPNRSVHGIFIDGDHSYEAVRADLAAWEPKLISGGILAGHDYGNNDQVRDAIMDHVGKERKVHLEMDWVWWWRVE